MDRRDRGESGGGDDGDVCRYFLRRETWRRGSRTTSVKLRPRYLASSRSQPALSPTAQSESFTPRFRRETGTFALALGDQTAPTTAPSLMRLQTYMSTTLGRSGGSSPVGRLCFHEANTAVKWPLSGRCGARCDLYRGSGNHSLRGLRTIRPFQVVQEQAGHIKSLAVLVGFGSEEIPGVGWGTTIYLWCMLRGGEFRCFYCIILGGFSSAGGIKNY